jgi:hypothetical protein
MGWRVKFPRLRKERKDTRGWNNSDAGEVSKKKKERKKERNKKEKG